VTTLVIICLYPNSVSYQIVDQILIGTILILKTSYPNKS
jgi:hypothetical protein